MKSARTAPNGKTVNDKVIPLVDDLNREMLRLPQDERRRRWQEYYTRLGELKESDF